MSSSLHLSTSSSSSSLQADRTSPLPHSSPSHPSDSSHESLEKQVRADRQQVLHDVKHQQHERFEQVEAQSHHLEDSAHEAIDMFARKPAAKQRLEKALNVENAEEEEKEKSKTKRDLLVVDDRDARIANLSLALIKAHQQLENLSSPQNTSVSAVKTNVTENFTKDAAEIDVDETSAFLSSVPLAKDEESLEHYLVRLPVKRGTLQWKKGGKGTETSDFVTVFVALTHDGMHVSESDGAEGLVIDLSRYWLIEKSEQRDLPAASTLSSQVAQAKARLPPSSPLSPTAGHSNFHQENARWILRLKPIDPTQAGPFEFRQEGINDGENFTTWVDAINLRISLLALARSDAHTLILAHGGREIVTFLCQNDSHSLLIENRFLDAPTVLGYFKESLSFRRDYSITLRNVGLEDRGVQVLSEILMLNSSIHSLDLSNNAITNAGVSYLATVLDLSPKLHTLRLDDNMITGEGCEELAQALGPHSLHTLSLRRNPIKDEGFASFAKLLLKASTPESVRRFLLLDVSGTGLSNASITWIGALLCSLSISALRLSHNALSDAGIAALVQRLLQTPSLLHNMSLLDLSFNQLGDDSLSLLMPLLQKTQASRFDVSGNSLSLAAVRALLNDEGNAHITIDSLSFTRVAESETSPIASQPSHAQAKSDVAEESKALVSRSESSEKSNEIANATSQFAASLKVGASSLLDRFRRRGSRAQDDDASDPPQQSHKSEDIR